MSDEWTDDEEEPSPESQVKKINLIPLSDLQALVRKVIPSMTLTVGDGFVSLKLLLI